MVMIRQLSMGPDLEIQILSMELNPVMRIHRQPETDS